MKNSIIVVGAGAAGLGAARRLQDCGQNVIVLEGRDRIGGRVYTSHRWEECPVDMGASWIHGRNNNPLTKLAAEAGIKGSETDYDNNVLYKNDGSEASDAFEHKYETRLNRILKLVRENATHSESVFDTLKRLKEWRSLAEEQRKILVHFLNVTVEHELSGSLNELSALNPDDADEFSGEDLLLHGGYDQIFQNLSKGLAIKLNTAVQKIDYGAPGISIVTNQGVFMSDKLLVTVPIGVLKSGAISFDPPLPESKQQSIAALGSGLLEKLYLKFPHLFWDQDIELINWVSEEHGRWNEWLNLAYYTQQPVLLGFNAADYARRIASMEEKDVVADAMEMLQHIYGQGIPQPTGWQLSKWHQDPFALGSYSFNAVGVSRETRMILSENIEERIYFAGEATSLDYPATVHGAYLSGVDVAKLMVG